MKQCTYCGKLHADEASVCDVDGQPLRAVAPTPLGVSEAEQSPLEKEHSKLGVASFGISIAVGLLLVAVFVVAGILNAKRNPQIQTYPGQMIVGFATIGLMVADVVAVGLGIASLLQHGKRRLFGILGLVFSSAMILGTIGLIIIGLAFAGRFAR